MKVIIDLVIIIVLAIIFGTLEKKDTIYGTGCVVFSIIYFIRLIIDLIKLFF